MLTGKQLLCGTQSEYFRNLHDISISSVLEQFTLVFLLQALTTITTLFKQQILREAVKVEINLHATRQRFKQLSSQNSASTIPPEEHGI